jgi:acetyl-CoA carboxylase beta subunit
MRDVRTAEITLKHGIICACLHLEQVRFSIVHTLAVGLLIAAACTTAGAIASYHSPTRVN